MWLLLVILQEGLDSEDAAERRAEQKRLIAMGPAAIPGVKKAAESGDPEVRMLANEILEEIVCEPGREVFDRQLALLKEPIRKKFREGFQNIDPTIIEAGYRLQLLDGAYLRKIFPRLKFYSCTYTLNGEGKGVTGEG